MFRLFLNQTHFSLGLRAFFCISIYLMTTSSSFAEESSTKKVKTGSDGSIVFVDGFKDNIIKLTSGLGPVPGELKVNCGSNKMDNVVVPDAEKTLGEIHQPCEEIVNAAINLLNARYGAAALPLLNEGDLTNVKRFTHQYQSSVRTCHQNQVIAATMCLSEENQSVQDMITYANMISGASMATSVSDSCGKMNKLMGLATAAMTAYQAACSAARSACLPSCSGAVNAMKNLKILASKAQLNLKLQNSTDGIAALAKLSELKSVLGGALAKDLNPAEPITTAGKDKACGSKYGQLLTSALIGVTGLVKAKKQAEDCEKATASKVEAASVDKCKDPKNANTMDCICEANPRTPGCSNGLAKVGDGTEGISVGGRGSSGSASNDIIGDSSGGLGDLGASANRDPSSTGGSGSSAGAAGGAMGAASTGSGGGGSAGGAKSEASDSLLPPPGFDSGFGGGGGGGSWGDFGADQGGENLEAFLPGGSLDPLADGMAGEDISSEITSEGGKSNWEKIRERYQDAAPNLIGGGS